MSSNVKKQVREVATITASHHQREGGGFIVRRPFPTHELDAVDPFLLIDEMGPVDYGPGEAVGAPDHPHRGFETVTYALEGEPGRLLLLAGKPLNEPVARYGPFVMNSRSQLIQAFDDFQSGRMGEITRTAEVSAQ